MKIFLGFFLLVCVIVFGIFFATPATQGQKEEIEEPTVVQKGQTTEKEREYSKEYKELYPERTGRKLSELSEMGRRKGNTREAGISIGIPTIPTVGNSSPTKDSEFFKDLSCKADAVFVGLVKNKAAHLTEDETFVYTEYEFSVEEIIKNNLRSPVEINNSIQVTRPGGLIKLDNQVIRVEDKLYEPLQTKKKYLLFLRFLPAAQGYIVSDFKGDFLLENNSFKKLSKVSLPKEIESSNDSQTLLNNVRNAVSIGCKQESKLSSSSVLDWFENFS